MAIALLDIDVLLALAHPQHVHHPLAHEWFAVNRCHGWATCPHTQTGFLRLSIQASVARRAISFNESISLLVRNVSVPEHHFWPLDFPVTEIRPEIRSHLIGHQQLADAILLELAIRRRGKLVTFDRGVRNLLTAESELQSAIEIL